MNEVKRLQACARIAEMTQENGLIELAPDATIEPVMNDTALIHQFFHSYVRHYIVQM